MDTEEKVQRSKQIGLGGKRQKDEKDRERVKHIYGGDVAMSGEVAKQGK